MNSNSNSNFSVSQSTRFQCLKRKLAADNRIWSKLYSDLLQSIIQYCDINSITHSLMHLNHYWLNQSKSITVWSNRTIELNVPGSIEEFELFINSHSYLINVNEWIWFDRIGFHYYFNSLFYIPIKITVLPYQSILFNRLKSIKLILIELNESAIIIICTSFNSLNSLELFSCSITHNALILLSSEQLQYQSSSNNISNIIPNRLLSQLKTLNLNSINNNNELSNTDINSRLYFLFNLINLESITIRNCNFNQFSNNNNNNNNSNNNILEFYSFIANRMRNLTYLNTNECKLIEFEESKLAAISQLIQRLNTCLISNRGYYGDDNQIASSDWIKIFKSTVINNNSPLQHIRFQYSAELIDYLIQFPELTRLDIVSTYITNTDINSLSRLSALIELHLSPYELSPLIFTEFPLLTKLKILYLGNINEKHPKLNYSELNHILIELLKSNSLIELYLNIWIEQELELKSKSTILTEFLELLSKFTNLKLLNICRLTLLYFKLESEFDIITDSLWLNEFRINLGKLLINTVIQLAID